ncbi:hypothetical protein ACQPYK_27465 [Streptosporangium sp. CA-135522]|uniref:hypothetical protein n=1 Tax=Streptosporangium sp. CA-135522 TaxID=3240072 RepID=UPI003D8F247B
MTPGPDPGWSGTDPLRQIHAAAAELAWTADEIREICARTTATLTAAATRSPGFPAGIHWSLLRALTNRAGLGYAFEGGRFGGSAARLGALAGRSSLATLVAGTSVRLRIAAVLHQHPELAADPVIRRLLDAVGADRDVEAIRAVRALFREKGATRAIGAIAPLLGEVLAMRALLGENSFGDRTTRPAATGLASRAGSPSGVLGRAARRRYGGGDGGAAAPAEQGPGTAAWGRPLPGAVLAGLVLAGLVAVVVWRRRAGRASRG